MISLAVGITALAGTWALTHGIDLRRTGKTLHTAPSPRREKTAA